MDGQYAFAANERKDAIVDAARDVIDAAFVPVPINKPEIPQRATRPKAGDVILHPVLKCGYNRLDDLVDTVPSLKVPMEKSKVKTTHGIALSHGSFTSVSASTFR